MNGEHKKSDISHIRAIVSQCQIGTRRQDGTGIKPPVLLVKVNWFGGTQDMTMVAAKRTAQMKPGIRAFLLSTSMLALIFSLTCRGQPALAQSQPCTVDASGNLTVQDDVTYGILFDRGLNQTALCSLTDNANVTVTVDGSITRGANEAVQLSNAAVGGIITNYGSVETTTDTIDFDGNSALGGIDNYGAIRGRTSLDVDNSSLGFLRNSSEGVISAVVKAVRVSNGNVEEIHNQGLIQADQRALDVRDGGTVKKIVNLGEFEGESIIRDYSETIYGRLIDVENVSGTIVLFENAQMGSDSNDRLVYSGILPTNYNLIVVDDAHYGKIEFVGRETFEVTEDYGPIFGEITFDVYNGTEIQGEMTFGISDLSGKITQLRYDSVISGLGDEFIVNESGGTYRGADWQLLESDEGVWDLLFSSLPLYNPSLEQVVAVPLSAKSASFSQQFDGSRVVMHLAESRNREWGIVPTADVIAEGEQSGDLTSMRQSIGETTLFGIVRGAWAAYNSNGDNPEYSANAWGMTFGAEHRFASIDATFGLFGSYSETDSTNLTSEDNVQNIGGGIHGNKELGAGVWFDGYGAYYRHNHEITRVDGADTYTADPNGRTWTAYGRLSYADWNFSGLAFTPYAAANYVDQQLEAYDEKESGGAALSVDEDVYWNILTYVGTTLSADVPITEEMSLLPKLDVAWVHLMKDGERSVTTTFVGETDAFAATIAGFDQDFARVEASLGLSLDSGLAMRVDYATELGNSDVEKLHEVRLEATYQF